MQKVKFIPKKIYKEYYWISLGALTGAALIITNDAIPLVLFVFCWGLFVAFSSLIILNRTFKLYDAKKFRYLAGRLSLLICLPLLVLIFFMSQQVHDSSIPPEQKIESILALGWLNKSFNEEQMINLLEKSDNDSYNDLLKIFGDKVNFSRSLSIVQTQYQAMKFIDYHSRAYNEEKVREMINHMSHLYENLKLSFVFCRYSHSFFIKQKVGPDLINELIASQKSYKQLAAIYFARNSLESAEFLKFYKMHFPIINKEVVSDQFVRKTITNLEKNK